MKEVLNSLSSLPYIENLYQEYLTDPNTVEPAWQDFFSNIPKNGVAKLGPSFKPFSLFNPPVASPSTSTPNTSTLNASTPNTSTLNASTPNANTSNASIANIHSSNNLATGNELETLSKADTDLQYNVGMLIRNYRVRGHIMAELDPLGFAQENRKTPVEMTPKYYGWNDTDMQRIVKSGTMEGFTLAQVFERLTTTYCRRIGVQFMHIDDYEVRDWLQESMEKTQNRLSISHDAQMRILEELTEAVVFEEFIQKKFVGVKSFALTGAESLIPLLNLAVLKAGEKGTKQIVLGMAHRGRLNVLTNICGKPARQIFREFDDADADVQHYIGRGDVKYHLGYSKNITTKRGKEIHISLCFNPSHLEFINPVVMGRVRAKQDRTNDKKHEHCFGILIHGDAAFIGEGIVQETLNLSELENYKVGGILHIILNNQIGFTTSPRQSRSTTYTTDVAKMLQSPIFHVNGEDPEAVSHVVNLAMDFRNKFKRDVVIDMYCYRYYGHNEADEPTFTQPLMYKAIKKRKSVRNSYLEYLQNMGKITLEEADKIAQRKKDYLEKEFAEARAAGYSLTYQAFEGVWQGYKGGNDKDIPQVNTGLPEEHLVNLLTKLTEYPTDFTPNSKIKRLLKQRLEMAQGKRPLDWASAEALALASLAIEGHRIRFSGQDVERGTFSHRHAVLHDFETDSTYVPLANLSKKQAPVKIVNSALSEAAVLGFEYGYSLDWPEGLTIWEAQFGDFANAGQVIFDQFISSGEDKWRRLSGLVVLLPHGFEGQGPEHSSARLERFLMLCAEDNMQVMNLTTPANYFHALRQQIVRPWRKPAIIMSPKSLLRHPEAVSHLTDLGKSFQKIIISKFTEVSRVILCSGKIYYDLKAKKEAQGRNDIAIIRLEQLYPFPKEELVTALETYPKEIPIIWVQEEPYNMGGWFYIRINLGESIKRKILHVTRPESASPATGSGNSHKVEQEELLEQAFSIN